MAQPALFLFLCSSFGQLSIKGASSTKESSSSHGTVKRKCLFSLVYGNMRHL